MAEEVGWRRGASRQFLLLPSLPSHSIDFFSMYELKADLALSHCSGRCTFYYSTSSPGLRRRGKKLRQKERSCAPQSTSS